MTNTPNRGLVQPARGEIWYVRFDPQVGSEINKIRPAVVVSPASIGRLPLRIVVPVTDWKPGYSKIPWFTFVPATPTNGLSKDSGADAFQVKSVSLERFKSRVGMVSSVQMDEIVASVALCVGYP